MTTKIDRIAVRERLQAIAEAVGNLDPDHVIEDAKQEDSPLHDAADWKWNDINGAVLEYRRGVARTLIRSYPAKITHSSTTQCAPMFARNALLPPTERGYVMLETVKPNSDLSRAIMLREVTQALFSVRRALAIAEELQDDAADVAGTAVALLEDLRSHLMNANKPDKPVKRRRKGGEEGVWLPAG